MNFWQRLHNGLFGLLEELNYHFIVVPKTNELLQKYFPGSPPIEELNKNISVLLLNSHVSANQPVPRVPNMIEIGSFHIYPPKKLPQDLQKYLDKAKDGVIYFSMGSGLQSKDLPEETKNDILRAFSRVNCKVLWKFEDDTLSGVPQNVKLVKWAPQQDVLGIQKHQILKLIYSAMIVSSFVALFSLRHILLHSSILLLVFVLLLFLQKFNLQSCLYLMNSLLSMSK